MKIYKKENVYDAALNRIRRLFGEFPNVIVSVSGGKDSTVCLELTLIVARELNRLPLSVLWIDQEVEWQGTVDTVDKIMRRKDVKPYWFQMPMVITNNASSYESVNHCWDVEHPEKWMREKSPISIKENTYGTEIFHNLFEKIIKKEWAGIKTACISGVRAEETPKRLMALTTALTYRDITWGKKLSKKDEHFTFYPIYDWSYSDVWKSILDNDWNYNVVYDGMYSHGVSIMDMRISNLHHETAIQNLILVQEIEPDTWNEVQKRIDGASAIKHLQKNSFKCPKDLPYMFKSWGEYAIHLNDHLVQLEVNQEKIRSKILSIEPMFISEAFERDFFRQIINTMLSSDWTFAKVTNFMTGHHVQTLKKYMKGEINALTFKYKKYLPDIIEEPL